MLFDLRSRGRRRTVQVVYLGLAILIGGGLVLFGVGTGSGNGGLLNAFTGGSNNQSQQSSAPQRRPRSSRPRRTPPDPAAWAALETARYQNASSSGFNTATGTYTTAGKKELANAATDAWQKYLALTKTPTTTWPSSPPTRTAPSATTPTRPPPGSSPPRRTRARSRASNASP